MRSHNLELDMILRGIIMSRGDRGATIAEMRADYHDIKLEPWPLQYEKTNRIVGYLLQIDGLVMERQINGPCVWYIDDLGNVSNRTQDDNNNNNQTNNNVITISSLELSDGTSDRSRSDCQFYDQSQKTAKKTDASIESGIRLISTSSNIKLPDARRKKHGPAPAKPSSELHTVPIKRLRSLTPTRAALSEVNLGIHDERTKSKGIAKKTTSTEVENTSTQNTTNESISLQNSLEIDSQEFRCEFERQCPLSETVTNTPQRYPKSPTIDDLNLFFKVRIFGDDFMRSLVSFTMFDAEAVNRGRSDKRGIFCESGLTIRKVFRNINDSQYLFTSSNKFVIVNLGALDILAGRDITDIQAEYARLIDAMQRIGLIPIITTLPPIKTNPQQLNHKQMAQSLLLLNTYLEETFGGCCYFIDLWRSFIPMSDNFYQVEAKEIQVDGAKFKIWPWNKMGRNRIIRTITNYLNEMRD